MQQYLRDEYNKDQADVNVFRMNILNEVHFLKNVEKTPSFIVCDGDNFFEIDM